MASGGRPRLGSNYILDDFIGRGAMGTVFSARSLHPRGMVAIKILHTQFADDDFVVGRFVRERRILRSIDHPNVVTVVDMVAEQDRLGIVMELVEGGDLRSLLAERPLSVIEAVRFGAEVANGLGAIHQAGAIHRDLKPANILVSTDATGLHPHITDFGMARLLVTEGPTTASVGTPLYMAPEIALGHPDVGPAADVYSLGVILFEMLVGRPPFQGPPITVLRAQGRERPPTVGNVPDDLRDLVDRMLAKRPEDRPPVEAVMDRLAAVERDLAGIDPGSRPVAQPPSTVLLSTGPIPVPVIGSAVGPFTPGSRTGGHGGRRGAGRRRTTSAVLASAALVAVAAGVGVATGRVPIPGLGDRGVLVTAADGGEMAADGYATTDDADPDAPALVIDPGPDDNPARSSTDDDGAQSSDGVDGGPSQAEGVAVGDPSGPEPGSTDAVEGRTGAGDVGSAGSSIDVDGSGPTSDSAVPAPTSDPADSADRPGRSSGAAGSSGTGSESSATGATSDSVPVGTAPDLVTSIDRLAVTPLGPADDVSTSPTTTGRYANVTTSTMRTLPILPPPSTAAASSPPPVVTVPAPAATASTSTSTPTSTSMSAPTGPGSVGGPAGAGASGSASGVDRAGSIELTDLTDLTVSTNRGVAVIEFTTSACATVRFVDDGIPLAAASGWPNAHSRCWTEHRHRVPLRAGRVNQVIIELRTADGQRFEAGPVMIDGGPPGG